MFSHHQDITVLVYKYGTSTPEPHNLAVAHKAATGHPGGHFNRGGFGESGPPQEGSPTIEKAAPGSRALVASSPPFPPTPAGTIPTRPTHSTPSLNSVYAKCYLDYHWGYRDVYPISILAVIGVKGAGGREGGSCLGHKSALADLKARCLPKCAFPSHSLTVADNDIRDRTAAAWAAPHYARGHFKKYPVHGGRHAFPPSLQS